MILQKNRISPDKGISFGSGDKVLNPLSILALINESGILQDLQMIGKSSPGDVQHIKKLADTEGFIQKHHTDPETVSFAQSF